MMKIDMKGLDDLLKKIRRLKDRLKSQDQRIVDLSKETILTRGPFLHEGTELLSKKESLKIEQDNPAIFALRRSINDQVEDILK